MPTPIEELGREAVQRKGWLGAHKWLMLRRLSQLGILVLFIAGPIGGAWVLKGNLSGSWVLEAVPLVEPFVFLQMLAAGMWNFLPETLIGVGVVTAFYALIGGRAYCSWVCPMNIVTDSAAWARRKLGIRTSARISPKVRWFMLAAVIALAAFTGQMAYELVNPVSLLHRELIFGGVAGLTVAGGIFLFDLLVARHGWCGHVCPMGAMYALLGSRPLVRVRSPAREKCDDCMECFEVCPEPRILPPALKQGMRQGLPPAVLSGLCTNCGRCVDICGKEVFTLGLLLPSARGAAGRRGGGGVGEVGEQQAEEWKQAS